MAEQIDPKTYQKLKYMVDFNDTLNKKPKEMKSNYRGVCIIHFSRQTPLREFAMAEFLASFWLFF